MNDVPLLRLTGISKSYNTGEANEIRVLDGAELTLQKGEVVALVAPSGAGKSTLLHIAGLLDSADSGQILLDGHDIAGLSDRERTAIRRRDIGFIYQFHHLLPEFSALENIVLPQLANNTSAKTAKRQAVELLKKVGLDHRQDHRPAQLSGGEQQRVAFCRAMANRPQLLLADEPTGNLDQKTSDTVFDALLAIVRDTGLAAIIATHNPDLAARMDRTVTLQNGTLT